MLSKFKEGISHEQVIAIKSESDENLRECLLRFVSQLLQENPAETDDFILKPIYQYASQIAFLPNSVYQH